MTDNNNPLKAGFQRIDLNKTISEIPTKYVDLNLIGAGAYGQVCAAKNTENGQKVAVKKLSRPFQSDIHAKRTYREVRMLKHMDHDNIINLLDIFTPTESLETFSDLYLVSELMGPDLAKVLRQHTLPPYQIQLYIYQILRALKYIHSAGIIHRDLKPGNIAAHESGELKVLDFGLARFHGHSGEEMTGYVATRWYRAPEIILSWMHYNHTADVWSVGCIMAEMFTGRVLFPGANTIDQLKKIMDILGTPDNSLLAKLTSDDARTFIESLPKTTKKPFMQIDPGFQRATPEAIDLLERMLDLDPDTRITAEQALAHEYLAKYGDPTDEPTSEVYDQSFENEELKDEEWKKLVYDEVNSFQPRPIQDMELE